MKTIVLHIDVTNKEFKELEKHINFYDQLLSGYDDDEYMPDDPLFTRCMKRNIMLYCRYEMDKWKIDNK